MVSFTFSASSLLDSVRVGAAPPAVNDWNGPLGSVDLAKPQDYTGDTGKLCFSRDGALELRSSLAYFAFISAGKPGTDAAFEAAITDTFGDTYFPLCAELIARYRVYTMFHHGGIDPKFRYSDRAKWPLAGGAGSEAAAVVAKAERIADEVYALLTADEEAEAVIGDQSRFVLLGILAGAIHRAQFEGHSWFTEEMRNRKSMTFRICKIAGMGWEKFAEYQAKRGHDGPHHLSDETMHDYALVIGQVRNQVVPAAVADHITYKGEPVAGKDLKVLFYLGEASKNRYPPGVLGSGAAITGLELTIAVLTDIGTKAKMTGHELLATNISKLSNAIKNKAIVHEQIINLSGILGPSLAWVWGYAEQARIADETDYVALSNHAKRYIAMRAAGKSCAQAMKRLAPHKQAMEGTLAQSIAAIAAAVAAAAAMNLGAAGGPALPLCADTTTIDVSKIRVEVAKKEPQFFDAMEE